MLDRYMLRGVWQALNCFSIHATYCVIIAGASPGETKILAAVRENGNFSCTCGSNNWETVQDRWVHAASGLASTELCFHSCNVLRDCHRGDPRQTKKMKAGVRKYGDFFCNCGSNNLETVVDKTGTCCEAFCKHRNVFLSMQQFARLAKQRPQGKEKRG